MKTVNTMTRRVVLLLVCREESHWFVLKRVTGLSWRGCPR